MKDRIVTMSLCVAVASVWSVACNVQQPRPECLVGRGLFAAKYTLKPSQTVVGACADTAGEVLEVEKYGDPGDPSSATIALKPSMLLSLVAPPSAGQPQASIITEARLARGEPDVNNLCSVPTFPPLNLQDPKTGTLYGYAFTHVSFYDTPAIPGTQFTADLAYTEGDGCTANYTVEAVYPAVACSTDADCRPQLNALGASLNPGFPVYCDTNVGDGQGGYGYCVLTKPVPAYNP